MKLSIGTLDFASQKEAKAEFQRLLSEAPLDGPIDNFELWLGLLGRHPNAEQKIGQGIREFRVRLNQYKTRCLYAVRQDGSEADFSYVKCLRAPTPWEMYVQALRKAVEPQIQAFREAAFWGCETVMCPQTGREVRETEVEVHHEPPFRVLVEKFSFALEKIDRKDPPISGSVDGAMGRSLEPHLEERWIQFHAENARMTVMSTEAHRNLPR